MMKEYLLDSAKAFCFFKEKLSQVNELSKSVLELLETKQGSFYAFLPENIDPDKIHDFNAGGKTSSLRNQVSFKLSRIINFNKDLICIFDDFNSDLKSVNKNDLYQQHGLHYHNEIYYQIKSGSNQEIVLKCLNYSSTIWHSLCVVFKSFGNFDKKISNSQIKEICRNSIFIMIGAYDSESYVCWCDSEGFEILTQA